jgi:hypothetical protein
VDSIEGAASALVGEGMVPGHGNPHGGHTAGGLSDSLALLQGGAGPPRGGGGPGPWRGWNGSGQNRTCKLGIFD